MKPQASFSVKKEWIEKAREQAFEQNKKHHALAFTFEPDGENYFIIDQNLFKLLKNYLEEEH